MSIHVSLIHQTHYNYSKSVRLSPQVIRLRPAAHCRTPISAYSLSIKPEGYFINWMQDPFGNYQARVVFPDPVKLFHVEVELMADMTVINPFDFFIEDSAVHYPFVYEDSLLIELSPYMTVTDDPEELDRWIRDHIPEHMKGETKTIDFLVNLNQRVTSYVNYIIRMEPGVQSCRTTLTDRRGSCRDSSFLLVQILRKLGFATRFVSGYLIQLKADRPDPDGPSGVEQDFTDLHAWVEVFLPGAGWIGLDPTSGLLAGEGHIPLACTPEPGSAAPITGFSDPGEVDFHFHMEVNRIKERPRVTLPYTSEQWDSINHMGQLVDESLKKNDVRLTMGGEPTFVSRHDMNSPEWTTNAHGEDKKKKGDDLLRKLKNRFAPGGILMHAQGKWYPGEELPRWAFGCWYRKDGVPIWKKESLIAKEHIRSEFDENPVPKNGELAFLRSLAKRLGIHEDRIWPAHEDVYRILLENGNLPEIGHLTPEDLKVPEKTSQLKDALESVGDVVGYVLPLKRDHIRNRWMAGRWTFGRKHLYLLPGDSPIGYRLPINSLPGFYSTEVVKSPEKNPLDDHPPLPDYESLPDRYSGTGEADSDDAVRREESLIITALSVEVRDHRLRIFLPPMDFAEHFLELVRMIELTAGELGQSVILEGYPPPGNPHLEKFQLTPDPGVLEVNIHPSKSWDEIVEKNSILYDEARNCGLGTEKFLLDGRHSGTGGGNHITLGGATPGDSPFFRRPDLLASMIRYWQNHPALSYFFSGLFLGPTSQHPRVDEARHENLYELETALAIIDQREEHPPWFLDRLLRNLLVDMTGNTHRTEFSIDKLHSPDSLSGRQGLLELRSFEMPPHEQMSAVQSLLVRALFAWFWKTPLERPLIRWGTTLHDRYLLPHFLWLDLKDVLSDLREAGFPLEESWFHPFFEFRFPQIGIRHIREVKLELRTALEVWHVLGEEIDAGGTARYVDSSCERIQVLAENYIEGRHRILVNGVELPMHPTEKTGEMVGAVRFKAWSPHSSLHPHVEAMSRLVFELFDTWAGRSLGGCTYHVSHPGGRNFESFPVNAFEAESRRVARFSAHGHTHGEFEFRPAKEEKEFTHTLDLRRYF